MNRVHVLHVSTVHAPYDQRIFEKEARSLAFEGFRVDVAMTVEKGELADSVTIRPLGAFKGSRFRRITRNVRALRYMLERYDIVHIHDPELLIAGAIANLFGRRVVYDVHEMHHTIFVKGTTTAFWVPPVLRTLVGSVYDAVERLALPRFAGIVVSMPEMLNHYKTLVPADRIALVRNFPQTTSTAFSSARHAERPIDEPYVIQTGGASYLRGFHVLVSAAELLRASGIDAPIVILDKIDIDMYPAPERRELLRRAAAANVQLRGRLPYYEMLRWVAHAHAGIASYLYHENAARCFATKIFEYFAFGIPVIVSNFGVNAELVRSHDAGIAVEPDSPESYACAIETLIRHPDVHAQMSQASAHAARTYAFESDFPNLVTLYQRILGASITAQERSPVNVG